MRNFAMLRSSLTLAAIVTHWTFSGTLVQAAEPSAEVSHAFKVTLVGKIKSEIDAPQTIDSVTEFLYTWKKRENEKELSANGFSVAANMDGKPIMNISANLATVRIIRDGITNNLSYETAPPGLKQKLDESYDAPICKLRVDKEGRELSRQVVALPGAQDLIDNGFIANAILFHPPYFPDKDEWQTEAQIAAGKNGYASGKLVYKKKIGQTNLPTFTVTGTLTKENFTLPGTPTLKLVRYTVNGEQTYDPALHDWIAGKFTMNVLMQKDAAEQGAGTAHGSVVVNFQMLPSK